MGSEMFERVITSHYLVLRHVLLLKSSNEILMINVATDTKQICNKIQFGFYLLFTIHMCACPEHQRWLVIEGGHLVTKTTTINILHPKMLSQPALMSKNSHSTVISDN